jgi:hypothetical protein
MIEATNSRVSKWNASCLRVMPSNERCPQERNNGLELYLILGAPRNLC